MNEEAEKFRVVTMKVLTMQLNSITIMDLVAYGGSALGIIVALLQLNTGNIGLFGCLLIILLSAEIFYSYATTWFIFPHCDEWYGCQ